MRMTYSRCILDVVIPAYALEKYEDIKEQVIETLCRRFKRTKDQKRRQIIIKHLTRLSLTEGRPRQVLRVQ